MRTPRENDWHGPARMVVMALLAVTAAMGQTPAWYNTGWSNRKAITINHTRVAGPGSLTNFPVLFAATDANLKTVGNGGRVGKADGTDILFTAADGVTKLNHELERYNAATGEVAAWVQIAALSPAADTVVYVSYGNASAGDQQNKTAVWSNGYKGVWHLGENAANTTVADSSGTGNTGTNQANTSSKTAAGKVGNGLTFNGSSDWVSIASSASLGSGLGSFTISAWVKKS
ncbi:MAG: DUF2341 domain-containing protein, partial [Bryobacterales bacterium]|nr:DUF2341 domain-containing protein [Bryobacterales bacterium]